MFSMLSPGDPIRSVDPIVFNRNHVGFRRSLKESDHMMGKTILRQNDLLKKIYLQQNKNI
jgi:hypothetical protein